MMRAGLYRPVHVKTLRSQKLRMLLTHRKLLQSKAIAIENDLRATLRNFGLKVGVVGTVKFEARIKELVDNTPDLVVLVEPLLIVRRVLREQIGILHRRLLAIVRNDAVCRRLMTAWLKAWAMKIARHRGLKKAIVALARRLAVIMHRIWVDGTEFRWTREVTAA